MDLVVLDQEVSEMEKEFGPIEIPELNYQNPLPTPSEKEIVDWYDFRQKRECKYCRNVSPALKASVEIDEEGLPLFFSCNPACQLNSIHTNILNALKLPQKEKLHLIKPLPPADCLKRTYMFVLARLSGNGFIKDSVLLATETFIANNLSAFLPPSIIFASWVTTISTAASSFTNMVHDAKGHPEGNHRIPYAAIISIAKTTVHDSSTNFVMAANHPDALPCCPSYLMEFLEEWTHFGVDLKNLHFAFAGVKLNRNYATVIPKFTYITGQDMFDFIQNRSNPWAPSIVGTPISSIMQAIFRCYQPRHYGFARGRNNLSVVSDPSTSEIHDTNPSESQLVKSSVVENLCESVNGTLLLNSLTMNSDSLVTLIEEIDDQKQVIIYDFNENKTTIIGIDVDAAAVNSTCSLLAAFNSNQKEFAIFNIVDRENVELVYQCSDVNYWKWISDETVGIVSEKVVSLWKKNSVEIKIFELETEWSEFNITNFEIDLTSSWLAISGSKKVGTQMMGKLQVFSRERNISDIYKGFCATFFSFLVQGNVLESNLICMILSDINRFKIMIKEIEAPAESENLKRFAKISIPLDYPPCDYPISIKICSVLKLIYIISKYGYLSIIELNTGSLLASHHFSNERIQAATSRMGIQGVYTLTESGKILSLEIERENVIKTLGKIKPILAEEIKNKIDQSFASY